MGEVRICIGATQSRKRTGEGATKSVILSSAVLLGFLSQFLSLSFLSCIKDLLPFGKLLQNVII